MISTKMKHLLRTGFIASCIAVMGCTSTFFVYAEPSTGELEEKTSGLKNELNDLNDELNTLGSELDSISDKIKNTTAEMESTQERMNEAQKRGEEQYEAMKLRIKYMYEAGDTSFLELLCSAENMTDFLNKTDFIKTVSEYDRDMLLELQNTQNEIKKEGEQLEEQQASLVEMQKELDSKRVQLESKISSTTSEMNQYSDLLAKAKAAEQLAAQQEAERQAALNTALSVTPPAGSQNQSAPAVTPPTADPSGKTSLGSFKVTHYCPCYYCSGGWGGQTATGTVATAGRTIAVDPGVISYGTRVILNGHVYVAEDCGGAINGNKIDIFLSDHATALAYGTYYTEVFLAD